MKKILLITILTLTLFVSVFPCVVYAETPWNVHGKVVYQDDVFEYDLSKNISQHNAKENWYFGQKSKWQTYRYLQTLPLPQDAVFDYVLPNFEKVVQHFEWVQRDKVDATVTFDKNGFVYQKEQNGIKIDRQKLFETLLKCVNGQTISLPLSVQKAITVEQVKQFTVVKAKFTTTFPNSNANRCHNIALATNSLNGTTVNVGESFSFNQVVGKRTEQNGYKNAKVIVDGAYVDGVGGGVCQVSTTLYNALLLAGILPQAHQHSLISNYVLEGFDAMVSDGGADLTFTNQTEYPLYIKGQVVDKSVTFTIFGAPNLFQIKRESSKIVDEFRTVEIVDRQKYPELVYTDQTLVVTNGSNGVKTQSYLKYYVDGVLVETKLIRKNNYKRVDKVIAKGYLDRPIINFVEGE